MVIIGFGLIILFASVLQTSTGFGFSIMATPFLLMIYEPREAIQINIVLSLIISAVLFFKIRQDIDLGIVKRFIIGSIPGLPIGIFLFLMANATRLKLGISIVILVLTFLLILKYRIKKTNRRDYAVGLFSGGLTTAIGMPGPPLLLYFSGTETNKESLRATTLAFYLFIYSASLLTQVFFAGTSKVVWTSSLAALPVLFIGLYIGQRIFAYINQKYFRRITYVILVFTGLYLLLDSTMN
ncbi:sulfite exporter TauE/SafE family protein [Sporosarcina siberiensis]|uniref:Probable membrane transporter protein n=1 Tax=Sporosarcina siberiensis TaxID=1365606 RepID=A0ABW4SI17_9BACL